MAGSKTVRNLIARLGRSRRGGVTIMSAAAGALICVSAALAVDVGMVVLKGRELQGAVDLSALAAAGSLQHAEAAAEATARANLADIATLNVQTGVYTPDPRLKPSQRFVAAAGQVNAAQVTATAPAPLFFGRVVLGRDAVSVTKQATAARPGGAPTAMFSIGSRLGSVDGGLANSLLSGLLGGRVSLTLMDYRSLLDAQVSLLQFSDALAADLGVTAGDYDALLKHEVETGRVLRVLERIAGSGPRSALSKLTGAPADARFKLGDLIGVEADARQGLRERLNAQVSVFDLLMASLQTANKERQLALDAGARLGIADLDVMLAIGERPNRSPWLTVTSKGEPIIRTAQTRIYLEATTAKALSDLTAIKLPVLIEAASAEARLKQIDCGPGSGVTLEVKPGVARAAIGAIDKTKLRDFKSKLNVTPAPLVSVLGLLGIKVANVTGRADIEAADPYWRQVRFTAADISAGQPKTVGSKQFGQGVVVSLLTKLDLKVELLGGLLSLPVSELLGTVRGLLTPLGPVLDAVVQPLLELLGVRLGEADLWVHGLRCPNQEGAPQLVG
ncbi:MAG TPA: TadG family pilus assembly protein [Brevundimonas sp.]